MISGADHSCGTKKDFMIIYDIKLKEREIRYPAIARRKKDDSIVLFHEYGKGVIIASPKEGLIGCYSDNWIMEDFELLLPGESITLTQAN